MLEPPADGGLRTTLGDEEPDLGSVANLLLKVAQKDWRLGWLAASIEEHQGKQSMVQCILEEITQPRAETNTLPLPSFVQSFREAFSLPIPERDVLRPLPVPTPTASRMDAYPCISQDPHLEQQDPHLEPPGQMVYQFCVERVRKCQELSRLCLLCVSRPRAEERVAGCEQHFPCCAECVATCPACPACLAFDDERETVG
eukprot:TRINITY_DN8754_c0_g1_i2.p1 TRINITY_DN8754_c0_g1~~TRINITY_DN8754_c0_g1_i2.p1  ORF type:complete len:200 (-),score=19.69 TRINITY_DN8754_c0_g1_i2:47-646(-)